jgi:hypothetical protein
MNPRHTWFWLFVAAGLFAFIFFYQRHARKPDTGPARVFADFNKEKVTVIQVLPGEGGEKIEIQAQRTNGAWQLTKPLVFPAQGASVERLLTLLEQLTAAMYLPDRELKNRFNADEEYGFATPQASIIIREGSHTMPTIRIGKKTAPGDQLFLQVIGRAGIYVVDAELLKWVPRKAQDWRDTTFVKLRALAFDRISVTNGAKTFELRRDATNQLWRMAAPTPARAYKGKIEESLQMLQAMQIRQFVSDDPKPDLEGLGLQPAQLEIVLSQGTNRIMLLQFGKSPTNDARQVYARRSGESAIFTVGNDALSPWRGQPNDFRDPFLLPTTNGVEVVEVRGEDSFSLRQETNGAWEVQQQNMPADAGLVTDLLSSLGRMQVVQFVKDVVTEPDLPGYGLAPALRQYILRSAGGSSNGVNVIANISFGTNQEDKVFARRADESFVYAVSRSDFERLPFASWQFRDRQISGHTEEDVTRATIEQGGQMRQVINEGKHNWSLAPGSQGSIEEFGVDQTVRGLCMLMVPAWLGCGEQQRAHFGLAQPEHKVGIELKDGGKLNFEFTKYEPNKPPYGAIVLDGKPWFFEVPYKLYRDILTYLSIPAKLP